MTAETMFFLIIGIVTFHFLFDQFLTYLNKTRWQAELPHELEGMYDVEKYRRQYDYRKANYGFGMANDLFGFALMVCFLLFGGFALVNEWVTQFSERATVQALLFFGILGLGSSLLNMPFSLYGTFVIEERFGFNKTTLKTYFMDLLKSVMLSVVIGGPLLALIIWLYEEAGSLFWLYAWFVISAFMVFTSMFYTALILPLFNKQQPLESGALREAIEAFSRKAGFKLDNIFVMDGSKRSTKANAFFSGLGGRKRIVLFDTLINDLETEQIVAVLAHEVGHYKLKHTLTGTLTGIAQTGIICLVFGLVVGSPLLAQAFGVEHPNFHIGLLAFSFLYSPVSFITGIVMSWISRKNEYAADAFAAAYGYGRQLVGALKTLSVNALSNLTPHPFYVFFHYSHPPLLARIKAIRNIKIIKN